MKNVHIRRLLLFFLCFSLISSLCVPVSAVGVDWVLRQIATDVAVTGILEGLGIFRDSLNGNDYFNNLVSNVKQHLIAAGQVTLEFADAYWRIDPLGQSVLTFPLAMIMAVRNYIFDNGIVTIRPSVSGTSYEFTVGSYSGTCITSKPTSLLVAYTEYRSGYECKLFAYSAESSFYSYNNGSSSHINSYQYGDYWVSTVTTFTTLTVTPSTLPLYHVPTTDDYYDIFYSPLQDGVYSDNPVALGVIPPSDVEFNVAYPQWLEHEKTNEDGSTETMVQIGLGNTVGETEDLTQEQIWAGQGSVSIPGQDVADASLVDILRSIIALPGQFVTSITTALSNFFSISGETNSFAIQLKDFFPFCIPFDLYDFLSVLSAAPEAPVFHWELPVPQLGRTFEIDVDLSPWDHVASLFRTFELLAFIVGLGMVTREKFLRS